MEKMIVDDIISFDDEIDAELERRSIVQYNDDDDEPHWHEGKLYWARKMFKDGAKWERDRNYINIIDSGTIKSDFLKIKSNYLYKELTRELKESIYQEFYDWLDKWDLDIKFNLVFGEQSICFEPIRNIDKYAIKGILDL